MKYLLIEKSKRVSVKPYQRKGKYVIGYTREDPREKKEEQRWKPTYVLSGQNVLRSGRVVKRIKNRDEAIKYIEKQRELDEKRTFDDYGNEIKVGEPYEVGTAFIGVPSDFVSFIEKVIPKTELKDLESIEEFSFHNFEECKTIPPKPFLNYLEKEYKHHPDYAGMYFHDIGKLVLDKTNFSFEKYPSFKKRAFLHEIGHHQWWYHMTSDDRKNFIGVWKNERVSDYANTNAGEGFAEAYAEYRYGVLQPDEFPNTYHLLFEIFDKRRVEKKQNVLVEAFGEAIKSKDLEWEVSANLTNGGHLKGVKIKAPTKQEAIEKYKKTFPKNYATKYFKKINAIEFDQDVFEE